MSEAEKVEAEVSVEDDAEKRSEPGPRVAERLATLPLEALLYYVMYGDDGLKRLT